MRKFTKQEFREEAKRFSEILEKNISDRDRLIEIYVEYKEQKEKLIEELLENKQVNLEVIKFQIGFLTQIISLIRYYRLEAKGEIEEARTCFYHDHDFRSVKKELYEKYKIK